MNDHTFPPKTRLERGFYNFLDETREEHNGLGSKAWKLRRRLRVKPKEFSEDFNISVRTYYNYRRDEKITLTVQQKV
jgi:hypothetical protein